MRAVDLLSRDLKAPAERRAWIPFALVAVAIAAATIATALTYSRAESRIASNDDQRATLQRDLALAEVARQSPTAATAGTSSLQTAVSGVLAERQDWGGILRGIGRVMPAGAWLTKLNVSRPEGGMAGSGEITFALSGCALSQGLVGRVVNGVGRLPGAGEPSVSSSQGGGCGRHPSFQLSFSTSRSPS